MDQISERDKQIANLEARLRSYTNQSVSPLTSPFLVSGVIENPMAIRQSLSSDSSEDIAALKSQASQSKAQAQLVQDKLNRAVAHLKRLTEENSRLSQRIDGFDTEMQNKEIEWVAKLSDANDLVSKKSKETVELQKLKNEITLVKEYNTQLEASVQESASREVILLGKLDQLENQLRTNISRDPIKNSEIIDTKSQSLEKLVDTLREEFKLKEEKSLEDLRKVDEKYNESVRKFENSSQQVLELESIVEALKIELETVKSISIAENSKTTQINELSEKFNEVQKANSQLKIEIEASKSFKESLEIFYSSLSAVISQLSESASKIPEIDSNNEPKEIDIPHENIPVNIKESLFALRQTIDQSKSDVRIMMKNVTDIEKSKIELNQSSSQLQTQIEQLQSQLQISNNEKKGLLEKISVMRNTIAPKLEAEIKESQRLRNQVESLTSSNNELTLQIKTQTQELESLRTNTSNSSSLVSRLRSELDAQSSTFAQRIESLSNEIEKKNTKLESLRTHLIDVEESATVEQMRIEQLANEYRGDLEHVRSEKEQWEALAMEEQETSKKLRVMLDEAREETGFCRTQLQKVEAESRQNSVSLANLQAVLVQFQKSKSFSAKDAEIEFAIEGMQKRFDETSLLLEEYRKRTEVAEEKLSKVDPEAPSSSRLQQELSEKAAQVAKLRHDVIQFQAHLAEALRRIRELSQTDDNVDRRLITNLFVSFCAAPRGDRTRFEILQVISSVLRFSEEEKFKVGLIRKPWGLLSSTPQPSEAPSGESFADLWISYLLKETSNAEAAAAQKKASAAIDAALNRPLTPSGNTRTMSVSSTTGPRSSIDSGSDSESRRGSFLERMLGVEPILETISNSGENTSKRE
ncbi:hypothetical protein HK096_003619 [Nowakowskiella sp. JEL0078]|nr:hypothetical protein HK096_003619 [Nowakowskiella sp. JEL0078]